MLWDYLLSLINRWDGECVIMGDFNEVRSKHERYGSVFNVQSAAEFNNFILLASLIDLPLDGYAYTWVHKSATKMSKLKWFLISKGLIASFPHLSAIYLDKHLSDYRPILMREMNIDYGPTPFRFFHSWFQIDGFDKLVEDTWMHMDITNSNGMILLKKKLQALKIIIREWTKNAKKCSYKKKSSIQSKLSNIDKIIDQGGSTEMILNDRSILLKELHDIICMDLEEMAQKAKVRWAIEGDENSKLSSIIPDLISDVQSAFISNRKILDGLFILNELLSWCKYKKLKAMVFKVDFEKDFDSIRWDYLDDVLKSFGFGDKWIGKFFNGIEGNERKLALISWDIVLASKKYGGLDTRTIKAIHDEKGNLKAHGNITKRSPWLDIVREINVLRSKEHAEVYYECMEPFKSLMCLWVRSKSIAAIWLEKVVTPLIEPAIKGFTAASAILKPKRLKVDKHGMSEPMSYYLIDGIEN
nr:RNA-directed DNA polymerase, eukaryota [Tanacetum cinerariifolium]